MDSKKTVEPTSIEKRISPFNCPSGGSMKKIVKTYGNGKQVLECVNCHIDKEKHIQKQITTLKTNTWRYASPCLECSSKNRYSLIETGKDVNRCADCDFKP